MQKSNRENCFRCCICRITDTLCPEFIEIGKAATNRLKKPLMSVIVHLIQSISDDALSITMEDAVCSHCYHDLLEYDDIIIRLIDLQQRFKNLLNDSKLCYSTVADTETTPTNESELFQETTLNLVDNHLQIVEFNDMEAFAEEQQNPNDVNIVELDVTDLEADAGSTDLSQDLPITSYIKCNHCEKEFSTRRRLGTHIEREHANQTLFRCSVCGKTFRNEEYLELHMNIHEGKTEYDCRYCPKRFSRKVNVIRHMQKHWNKQNFQCEKCGLRFSDNSLLYNHKLLHEAEETPIICAVCQQMFKSRRTYKNHLLTHKEDRTRYPCEVCGKLFVEKYTLKIHQRSHEYNVHIVQNCQSSDLSHQKM